MAILETRLEERLAHQDWGLRRRNKYESRRGVRRLGKFMARSFVSDLTNDDVGDRIVPSCCVQLFVTVPRWL